MVKLAPAVVRATDVLDFFVARAGQTFTLSEVAEAVDVRPGTLLSILQALTDRGYLARHPRHKTYVLGPALIAAGHAALLPYPIIDVARREIHVVAEQSGGDCAALLAIGDHLVVVAAAGRATDATDPMLAWMGAHTRLHQPFGGLFVAWSDASAVEHWIGAECRQQRPEHAARLELVVARAREDGYSLGIANMPENGPLGRVFAEARARPHVVGTSAAVDDDLQRLSEHIVAINLGERPLAEASTVVVPVFGRAGEVALALISHGFPEPLTPESLHRLVGQLTRCATLITKNTFRREELGWTRSRSVG